MKTRQAAMAIIADRTHVLLWATRRCTLPGAELKSEDTAEEALRRGLKQELDWDGTDVRWTRLDPVQTPDNSWTWLPLLAEVDSIPELLQGRKCSTVVTMQITHLKAALQQDRAVFLHSGAAAVLSRWLDITQMLPERRALRESLREAALEEAESHWNPDESDPDQQIILYHSKVEETDTPLRLLLVTAETPPVGICPLVLGPYYAFPTQMILIEITPVEYQDVLAGRLELPEGWDEAEKLARPDSAC